MRRTKSILTLILAGALAGFFMGCEQEGPAERAGEQVDQAAEQAGERMEEAGEKVE